MEIIRTIRNKFYEIVNDFKNSEKEKKRIIILAVASVVILDYMMFCYHIEKNIFNIFPSIPVIKNTRSVDLYLPSYDDMSIIVEKREIPNFNNDKRFVRYLFNSVVKGSLYENTSLFVPLKIFVRNIWFLDNENKANGDKSLTCLIDVEPGVVDEGIEVISGSEELLKKALGKTISENLPNIGNIILAENGVPYKQLWDVKENRP